METSSKSQFITILRKISRLNIDYYEHNEYYKKINNIQEKSIFPILSFKSDSRTKYYKYQEILYNFIDKVQKKLSKGIKNNKLPTLCPLESVILLHMIKLHDDGKYSDITIILMNVQLLLVNITKIVNVYAILVLLIIMIVLMKMIINI